MKVINLFGGPGSGKSTVAAGLFYQMKLMGFRVELVTEFAKDLVYEDRTSMLEYQEYLFAEQHNRIRRVEPYVDWAIVDSPLLLNVVYQTDQSPAGLAFNLFAAQTFLRYDNVNFFLVRPRDFQQYRRVHILEQSEEIDKRILDVLQQYDVKYCTIPTNEHTIDRIVNKLPKE